jgi:outer membrane protein assembly factor BamE
MRLSNHKLLLPILLLAAMLSAAGCVYRANMSQGNIVIEEDLDQVEVGMTRNQIRFLLGTPMIDDPFHMERWDYVYYVKIGRRDATAKRWVSILFTEDVVSEIRRNQELNPDL